MDPIALNYVRTENGFCSVYYRRADTRKLYCFQLADNRSKTFDLMVCTQDGEPSHKVDRPYTISRLPPDDCATARDFIAWRSRQQEA